MCALLSSICIMRVLCREGTDADEWVEGMLAFEAIGDDKLQIFVAKQENLTNMWY